ncbi:MAG: helix-turn-helix transcriptional regulator [Acidaminococcaceae bacterium]
MTVLERIQELGIKNGITISSLEKELKLGKGTIYKWGESYPNTEKLTRVADYFKVSVDFLLGREEIELNKKDEKEIQKLLDGYREQLMDSEGLMFDGDPATPEAIESILDAMKIGLEMAKKKNKEKYTPKKYRK